MNAIANMFVFIMPGLRKTLTYLSRPSATTASITMTLQSWQVSRFLYPTLPLPIYFL